MSLDQSDIPIHYITDCMVDITGPSAAVSVVVRVFQELWSHCHMLPRISVMPPIKPLSRFSSHELVTSLPVSGVVSSCTFVSSV